ncbi:MAG: ATP-binding protein [Pseudomonadota bacterium]
MKGKVKCWEFFRCDEYECPVYKKKELKCWLIPGTHCRSEIQGRFLEKMEMCLACEPFNSNLDQGSIGETLQVVNRQFIEFRRMVDERDRELEGIGMELALGLSEVIEALKEISAGDPMVRVPEVSELGLITKLKSMVNVTAKNLAEIVDLSHEFAIGLAEHFDVLQRVSKGDLTARVYGISEVELLESLKRVTNHMIESVAREIREREQAEEALRSSEAQLRESEEKYRFLFDYDPNSVFVLDPETYKILDVNTKALDVYDYEKEQILDKSFLELGPDGYADGVLSGIRPIPAIWSSVYPRVRHLRKDGAPFYVSVYACQRRRSLKYGIIATTVDITELLEKESQLIQASKMTTLGEMATGVAHELNQPLSVIKTASSFLKRKVNKKEPIRDEILLTLSEEIDSHVDRASKIINHLREFGRKSEVEKEEVYVNDALNRALDIFSQQFKLRKIVVVKELGKDLPPIKTDSNRLEQIFVNLLMNARDAIDEKWEQAEYKDEEKKIFLKTRFKEGKVIIEIRDTGTGISRPVLDKIFEPFFTTKKVGKGTGLGLSISYGIVQDYDGTIKVETEEDVGATFIVKFPVSRVR